MGFFRFLVVFCICIHLIPQREIADIIDVQYDFRETYNFADLLGSLTNGSVDAAVANISVTFEREQRMDFSQPIFDSGLMVLASVDGQPSVIGTLLSRDLLLWLLGAFGILLIAANLIYFSERKHNPAFQHSYLKGLGEGVWWAFKALEDGKIDAVVHDAPIVAYYAATVGKGRFTTVGRLFHPEKYGIALPSGSTRTEQINLALLQLRENGTYANLVDKWFGDGYQN